LGIAAAMICVRMLPLVQPNPNGEKLDIVGAFLLPLILALLILGINFMGRDGIAGFVFLVPLALSVMLTIFFYHYEKRATHPLVDFTLLFRTRFLFSNIAGFISYFSGVFVIILIPFYNEEILNLSASNSGKVLLTLPLVGMFLAPLAGMISDRIGQRILASGGLLIATIGTSTLFSLKQSGSPGEVMLRLAIIGVGTGLFTTPNSSAIMGAIPVNQRGLASGMLATVRNLGLSLGVAASTSLFSMWNRSMLIKIHTKAGAFLTAFDRVLVIAIAALVIGTILSFLRGNEAGNESESSAISK